MPLALGQVLHNRYRIVKLIGQGGFGAVYRAWDTAIHQPCAVKENLDTSPEAQRQFQREASILAGLRHPNLPRVTDHFFISGQGQYLVMDFVEGQSLDEIMHQKGRPRTEQEALPWIEQVCQALDYLHRQQPPIIHRDIKPQNIIVTQAGQAMLVDFGISKVYDPLLSTTTGAQAVTPGFSPPEQYGQGRTDPRSDVYALGATMYALLTGQTPPDAIDRLVHGVPLTPPRQVNRQVSLAVDQAIMKAMEVDAKRRHQSAAGFQSVLRGVGIVLRAPQPQPIPMPQPLPMASSTGRAVRMPWLVIGGIGGVLIVLVLCLVAATVIPPLIMSLGTHSIETPVPPILTPTPGAPPTSTISPPTGGVPAAPDGAGTAPSGATATSTPTSTPTPFPTRTPTPTDTPQPTGATPGQPTRASLPPAAASLAAPLLLDPPEGASAIQSFGTTFKWRWDGQMAEGWGFEVRIWQEGDPDHFGAFDAGELMKYLDHQPNSIYAVSLLVEGAYTVRLHGIGDYCWTVAVMQLEPYARVSPEAPPCKLKFVIPSGPKPLEEPPSGA